MLNTMVITKLTKSNYDEWKEMFDGNAEIRAKFMRDTMVGKVDENTAIITAEVFDREGMKEALSSPEMNKQVEEMGIERTIYMLQPAPAPSS